MLSLAQIIVLALKSTSRKFGWWILAFLQFIFFVAFFKSLFAVKNGTMLGLLCLLGFSAVTCSLWLDIRAVVLKAQAKMSVREFFSLVVNFALIFLIFFALGMTLRVLGVPFYAFELLMSIIFATTLVLLLNLVMFKQKFFNALLVSLDMWKKTPLLGVTFSASIFILFNLCLIFSQKVLKIYFFGEFSVLNRSATIWVFGFSSVVCLAFILACFNSFWVLCVLEKIRPLNSKEHYKTDVSITAPEAAV